MDVQGLKLSLCCKSKQDGRIEKMSRGLSVSPDIDDCIYIYDKWSLRATSVWASV